MRCFCVRIRVRGDANSASGAGIRPRATPKNFLTITKEAEGGTGEAAKMLKGNFGVAKLFFPQFLSFSNGRLGATNQRHALIVRDGH
jgi:hypothetical protein